MVPEILIDPKKIFPVPDAFKIKSEFDAVAFISLSVILMFPSKVRFDITTEPVPPGSKRKSAFELVLIMLSLNVMLSIVVAPTKAVAPDTDNDDKADEPAPNVPVVERFSFPKLIAPDESFIIPLSKSKFPNCEPVAADNFPVVLMFSSAKLIDPPK